jgi:hypothetical protein
MTNRHHLPLGDERFWREVTMIPELTGHPWQAIATYGHRALVDLEHQLRLDITTLMAERQGGGHDPGWHQRAGKALGIKQQQLVAIRTLRRTRQAPSGGVPLAERHAARATLEHLARVCRVLLVVTDPDEIALVEAEIARTLARVNEHRPLEPEVLLARLREESANAPKARS